jgi:hypothetical protein
MLVAGVDVERYAVSLVHHHRLEASLRFQNHNISSSTEVAVSSGDKPENDPFELV